MQIENGSTVKIHYTLTVDGEVVDSSSDRSPFSFTQGTQQVISGLEEHLEGKSAGEKTSVVIPPEKAYGSIDPNAFQTIEKEAFEDVSRLEPGIVVQGRTSSGQPFTARIAGISDDDVTLDLNHPLAGKTLEFEIEILEVS